MITSKKMMRYLLCNGIFLIIGLLLALGLKYHYSRAGSDELLWILSPTARLVEFASGIPFEYEANTGFVSRGYRTIIAPSCAGINFLIVAFCMAMFSGIHTVRRLWAKLSWLTTSFLSAYFLTVGVNAIRIIVSIFSFNADIYFGWMTPQRVHRLEGIVIYFFFLCLFYMIIVKVIHQLTRKTGGKKQAIIGHNCGVTYYLRWVWAGLIPLFWYTFVTLGVPLLNGAYHMNAARFTEHGGMVLAASLAVLGVIFSIRLASKLFLRTLNIDKRKFFLATKTRKLESTKYD